jgi:hypothetical protein
MDGTQPNRTPQRNAGAAQTTTTKHQRKTKTKNQALKRFRPLAFRRASVLRPDCVLTRLRKPWRRFWMSRVARAMVGRGPQRIWLAQPASAGCDVMARLGSRSSSSVVWQPASAAVVVVVVVAAVVVRVGDESNVWFGARKTVVVVDGCRRVGRRVGRLEKGLFCFVLFFVS